MNLRFLLGYTVDSCTGVMLIFYILFTFYQMSTNGIFETLKVGGQGDGVGTGDSSISMERMAST